jgi:hypothetical protein
MCLDEIMENFKVKNYECSYCKNPLVKNNIPLLFHDEEF